MRKFVLGTAQLGFDYGIINKEGKPNKLEAFEILETAAKQNIGCFDTAYSYGSSEEIIGDFLQNYKFDIKIITKLPKMDCNYSKKKIHNFFFTSLDRLKQKNIFCYMVHSVTDVLNDQSGIVSRTFEELKKEGLIEKIGVSVYEKKEIAPVLEKFDFDVIQLPFSIFDQKLLQDSTIKKLKKFGKEIHVRSVFLQGLIFSNKHNLPDKLKNISEHVERLERLGEKIGLSKEEIALLFVYSLDAIDRVVVGVDNVRQLKKNINILNKLEYFKRMTKKIDFDTFRIKDPILVDPRKWNS